MKDAAVQVEICGKYVPPYVMLAKHLMISQKCCRQIVFQAAEVDVSLSRQKIICTSISLIVSFAFILFVYLFFAQFTIGYSRNRRRQRSLRYHPNRRQLHEYRESRHVGQERL